MVALGILVPTVGVRISAFQPISGFRRLNTFLSFALCSVPRCEMRDGFYEIIMKKILKPFATIALLCAMVFLAGEWPEDAPRKKVLTCDGVAFATMLVCGIYLKRENKEGGGV